MSVRRLTIPALAAVLAALWAPAALAAPIDPATPFGVPESAPGCPAAPDCTPPSDTTSVPAAPASGWFTTPTVNATLGGSDAGSGLAAIEYAIDRGDVLQGTNNQIVSFTGDGDHSLAHRAVDVAGNKSGWVLDTLAIDATKPVNTTAAVDPAVRASATITVTGSDPAPGSGIASVKWQVDGGPVGSGPSGTQVTITADGAHTLRTWAVDVAGNASDPRDDTVNIDAVKPVDTTVVPAGWVSSAPALITLSGTDGGGPATSMEYQLDGLAVQSLANGGTVSIGADGYHTLKHRAVDAVGNRSDWITDSVRVDGTPPVNTSVAPAGWRDPDQHVTVSGTDATSGVASVQWQVDGGTIVTGASGADVVVTGDGAHDVRTRVLDVAGNASAWRTDTVRVDTLAPVDQTAPPGGWQAAPITVSVVGSDAHSGVASVEWTLDGGAVTAVTAASTTVTVAGDGQHTLRTRVTDNVGHRTGWKSHTLRVDTTAPANTTDALPNVWHNGRVAVALAGADGGAGLDSMEWSVDGAPVQSGPDGTVVAVTADGTHTLQTRAVDLAGNASGWRSDPIRIDSVRPTDTTTVAATVPYGTRATIAGSDAASGIATVEWDLDGVAGSGPSPSQVALGGGGAHTLRHRVLDQAGNASPWRTDTVTVDPALNNDTTPPVDTTTVPAAWQTASPVTVTVTGTDADTAVQRVEWREDGGSPRSGPSGSTFTVSGDGRHHVETRVVDVAGNTTAWTDRVVRIDGTRPVDATRVAGWQSSRTVTLAGSDATAGIARMEWWVDGGPLQTGPAGSTVTFPADGVYTLEHRAVDAAENVSARASDTVRIDSVNPVDTTPAAPAGWAASGWTVTPSGTDAGSGVAEVQARLDGQPVTQFPVVADADGDHTLETQVLDAAGNASGWRAQAFRVDTHAPADTTPAAPDGWRSSPWTVAPSADDGAGSGVASVEWKLGAAGAVSTAPSATVSAEGETVLMTRATDAVGHVSAWRSQTVRIDTGRPAAALACAAAAAPTGWTCRATATDALSGVASIRWRVGGGAWQAPAGDGTFTVAAGTVEAQATDRAGLTADAPAAVLAERVAPAPAPAPTTPAAPAPAPDPTSAATTVHRRSVAVKRRGTSGSAGLLGAFELRSARAGHGPADASADVRPLSLGRGRYRVTIRLVSGQLTAERVRVMHFGSGGWSPRMGVALSGVTKPMRAQLTVERSDGGRWRTVALAAATLRP